MTIQRNNISRPYVIDPKFILLYTLRTKGIMISKLRPPIILLERRG